MAEIPHRVKMPVCRSCSFAEADEGDERCPDCDAELVWVDYVPSTHALREALVTLLDAAEANGWDTMAAPYYAATNVLLLEAANREQVSPEKIAEQVRVAREVRHEARAPEPCEWHGTKWMIDGECLRCAAKAGDITARQRMRELIRDQ